MAKATQDEQISRVTSLKGWLPEPAFVMAKKSLAATATTHARCDLCQSESHVFQIDGNPNAELLWFSVGPWSEAHDLLLNKMIEAMGSTRKSVLRMALVAEADDNETLGPSSTCVERVMDKIKSGSPKLVLALGTIAGRCFGSDSGLVKGKLVSVGGLSVMITDSLDALIQNPGQKKATWEHLKTAMKFLNWHPTRKG